MILIMGYGGQIEGADNKDISRTINDLSQREDDGDSFAVLEADPTTNDFMQTIVDGDGTFCVEYRERSKEKHYSVDGVLLTSVISLFQLYRAEDVAWKDAVAWKDISDTMEW